uniref:Clan AA aspartic protease n=1 Tax=Strongyloides venezuelensis TaxID=75913 RepID=A0A0K0FWF4_STRVS
MKEQEIYTDDKNNIIIGSDTLMDGGANISFATREITMLGRLVSVEDHSKDQITSIVNCVSTVKSVDTLYVIELKEEINKLYPDVISNSKTDLGCCKLSAPKL